MCMNSIISLVFPLFLTWNCVQAAVLCPTGWTPSEVSGTCIRIELDHATDSWFYGRYICQTYGGDIVKILNQEMNDLVFDLMVDNEDAIRQHTWYDVWIGLNDADDEGIWRWLDEEEEVTWTNWKGGEAPDGYYVEDADCASIDLDENGVWDDGSCYMYNPAPYICEIPALPTTTTSAATTTAVITTTATTAATAASTTVSSSSEVNEASVAGLSTGAIFGIVIALILVLMVPVVYGVFKVYQRRQEQELSGAGGSSVAYVNTDFSQEEVSVNMKV